MYVSEHEIIVKQPIQFVYDNVTCMKGCINWSSMLRATEKIGNEPVHVGSQYKHTGKFMGFTAEVIVTVRALDPLKEFAIDDFEQSSMPISHHYTFEETPEGVRVHDTMTINPPDTFIGKLSAALIVQRVQAQQTSDLNNLKDMLDSGMVVQAS